MTKSRGVADWGHYPPVNNNILINPSFTVKQRGGTIEHTANGYGPDRWFIRGASNTGGSQAQSSTVIDPDTGTHKMKIINVGATSYSNTFQQIEAVNLQGLYGKEMTFSFSYSDVGGSGIPKVEVRSYDSSDTTKILLEAVPTSLGDNRWTCTFTLSTEDGTFPGLSARGLRVLVWANEANTAPNEWYLWETKLEVGSRATPFIARSWGDELALCDRFFQRLTITSGTPLPCIRRGNNHIGVRMDLRSKMRTPINYSAITTFADANVPVFTLRSQSTSETFTNPGLTAAHTNWVILAKDGLSTSLAVNAFYHTEVGVSIHFFESEL
jgi:hypothetical protein